MGSIFGLLFDDFNRVERDTLVIRSLRIALGDLQQHVHPFDHPAKDAVFIIQPGSGNMGDEELAAICSRSGVRHRKDPRLVVLE